MRPVPRHLADEALIDRFLAEYGAVNSPARGTLVAQQSVLRRFLFWCREQRLDARSVAAEEFRGFLEAERARGISPSTLSSRHSMLRLFYDHLDGAARNPARLVAGVQPDARVVVPYRPAEAQAILTRLSQAEGVSGRFDQAVVATVAGTGVRRGELLRLRVGDLDLDAGLVTVTDEHGRKRQVPIRLETAVVLAGYLGQVRPVCPASPWLFANPRASFDSRWYGRLEPFVAGAIVRRAGRATEIEGPHTCTRWRITAGVDLLRTGVPVEEVAHG